MRLPVLCLSANNYSKRSDIWTRLTSFTTTIRISCIGPFGADTTYCMCRSLSFNIRKALLRAERKAILPFHTPRKRNKTKSDQRRLSTVRCGPARKIIERPSGLLPENALQLYLFRSVPSLIVVVYSTDSRRV